MSRFTKIFKAANPISSAKQLRADMKAADSTSDKRAALRRQHFRTIHPFHPVTGEIVDAQEKIDSGDPALVEEGRAQMAVADEQTKVISSIGAAVGLFSAFGGSSGDAGSGGAAASGGGVSAEAGGAAASVLSSSLTGRSNPPPQGSGARPQDTMIQPSAGSFEKMYGDGRRKGFIEQVVEFVHGLFVDPGVRR